MLTHSKIPKFAFIGTSSSGKTTATYQTCGLLKEMGIRVDGILQQDRRLPFPPSLLETHAEAQYWFITNMMTVENYLVLQQGVDCIVSDRSVVDFFAYAETQWPRQLAELRALIVAWASTYECLFYLKPRAYDNDGVRPSDEFRLAVDKTLTDLLATSELRDKVVPVRSWEEAANLVAVAVKRNSVHPNARLTGSRYIGNFHKDSDFDFILLESEWADVPLTVRSRFQQVDHLATVMKHNDLGLIAEFVCDAMDIGIQLQRDEAALHIRLDKNKHERVFYEETHT